MQQQQQQQQLTPQGFGVGAALSPMQGIGASSSSSSSQAAVATAAAADAARARAAEQMAYEDAWKACNPDFTTPFASVEDAVTRLLPYHVFTDYDDEDTYIDAAGTEKSSAERWDNDVTATMMKQIAEFEKHVLTFNVIARQRAEGTMRGEEQLLLERALIQDEFRASDQVRVAHIQQQQQEEEEAARASRLALAQAQAQVANAWPLVQPSNPSGWQQALAAAAAAAAARADGVPAQMATAQGVAMHPQLDPSAAGAWLMMKQQQHHHHQQQQQQQLGLGVWPTFAAPHGVGSSNGQAGPSALWQEQAAGEQTTSGTAVGGMAQPWWAGAAQRREQ
ncbi:hypothetical protein CFC21_023617 [Triticum aestivum]|uniref:GLTSCR protein conserved domain-containing protein n=2 Tax=Triticum aestivum TaxID=4565 RepID=A0A3B6C925_WHEAT|nr:uncharacterized protein LOC123041342 [Triticum aestivum]KAF7008977.1 hypothetical protein CFC21_023617 [Triticum aestivum]